jgi:FkbM family methyltransferase
MGKMISYYFNKIVEKFTYYISSEAIELRRVKKIPRYQTGTTKIFGFEFTFVDSASFIGQYQEIFKKQAYQFKNVNEQPVIIDCGANIGVSILYYTRQFPNAKILAFEPDKNIFPVLKKNIEKIENSNVTLINKGLWDTDGKMIFIQEGADGGHLVGDNINISIEAKIAEIETTRLKDYLKGGIDFLKIDIEGAEVVVIEDCKNYLENVQQIFIEFHSTINKRQQLDSILSILANNNFRYFIESVTLCNERPFIKRKAINNFDNLLSIYAYK